MPLKRCRNYVSDPDLKKMNIPTDTKIPVLPFWASEALGPLGLRVGASEHKTQFDTQTRRRTREGAAFQETRVCKGALPLGVGAGRLLPPSAASVCTWRHGHRQRARGAAGVRDGPCAPGWPLARLTYGMQKGGDAREPPPPSSVCSVHDVPGTVLRPSRRRSHSPSE